MAGRRKYELGRRAVKKLKDSDKVRAEPVTRLPVQAKKPRGRSTAHDHVHIPVRGIAVGVVGGSHPQASDQRCRCKGRSGHRLVNNEVAWA